MHVVAIDVTSRLNRSGGFAQIAVPLEHAACNVMLQALNLLSFDDKSLAQSPAPHF